VSASAFIADSVPGVLPNHYAPDLHFDKCARHQVWPEPGDFAT
jgi:hypothetical protein